MFLLQTLKSHLNEECAIVYREFSMICGTNIQAATMLSKFVYWSDVVQRTQPEKCGWFFKTAQHLYDELGFTRRAYEKARNFLIEKGLLQYRRSGVHGKMHFCVNFERILELVYQVKGIDAPKDFFSTQIDINNFQLPKWIPLQEWNAYLHVYKEKKGKFPNNSQKSALIKQLAQLRSRFDLTIVMQRSIVGSWIGFFPLDYQPKQDNAARAIAKAIQVQQNLSQSSDRPKTPEPPSRTKSDKAQENISNILGHLKKVGNR